MSPRTTATSTFLRVAAGSIAAALLVSTFWAQSSHKLEVRMGLQKPPKVVFPAAELPAGEMQQKATTACMECHEARIILQQRLSKAAWTKEVDKMIKWGAVVDASDRDALIDYFSANFNPDQPPYVPARTATEAKKSK